MSTTPRKVLLTGVAGFLGSNLLERLLTRGARVVGIDNFSMGNRLNLDGLLEHEDFELLEADVTRRETFEGLCDDFDCIVHLAAFKIPRYGKAIDTLRINYHGTENVLEFARRGGTKCVLASTSDVYGRNPDVPFSEEGSDSVIGSATSPRWAYAVSKLFDEHLALAYQDAYGFPVVILRIFGSYGPRQHLGWWGGAPPVFIDAALRGDSLPVHGDGSQTRSFTYVSDTIDGIYEAIARPEAEGAIINLGSREEISILELARKICRLAGSDGKSQIELVPYASFTGKRYDDVMRRVPDTRLAGRLLGFSAKVALDEGLRRTIEWQRAVTGTPSAAGGADAAGSTEPPSP